MQTTKVSKTTGQPYETEDDLFGQIVLGKRRRGRKESDFKTYQVETETTINNVKLQIE